MAKPKNKKVVRKPRPNVEELTKITKGYKHFLTSIEVKLGRKEFVLLKIVSVGTGANALYDHKKGTSWDVGFVVGPGFKQGLLNLAKKWPRGKPRFETVKVKVNNSLTTEKEVNKLAIAAWFEAFGIEVPSEKALQKHQEAQVSYAARVRDQLIAELRAGAPGVARFNACFREDQDCVGKLEKEDLSNLALVDVSLFELELAGTRFDGSDMREAALSSSNLQKASLVKAKLDDANLYDIKCESATFEGASLRKCYCEGASFRCCNFKNADLTNANLSKADIGGADFTGAKLDGVVFDKTKFDEKTIFPPGFTYPSGLEWKGVGPRPSTPSAKKSGSLDFDTFIQNLNKKVELARMEKAGSMLKAERFQLFAEVKADSLVGVVKSQTSKDLVYSCRLASDGAFSCCTQNLKPCGGLRGALCKHLLVLIVGLAKAGQFDAATVDHWIDLSRSKKPAIDEDVMSATFLRYKGAEAGEVDWRPTETIPEDFYAM